MAVRAKQGSVFKVMSHACTWWVGKLSVLRSVTQSAGIAVCLIWAIHARVVAGNANCIGHVGEVVVGTGSDTCLIFVKEVRLGAGTNPRPFPKAVPTGNTSRWRGKIIVKKSQGRDSYICTSIACKSISIEVFCVEIADRSRNRYNFAASDYTHKCQVQVLRVAVLEQHCRVYHYGCYPQLAQSHPRINSDTQLECRAWQFGRRGIQR